MAVKLMEREVLVPPANLESNGKASHEPAPLQPGDFLTRPEFERRYQLHPEIKKAELIEGIVYPQLSVSALQHGDPHFNLVAWLGSYSALTLNITGSDNASLRLDLRNEPQPDALLRLDPELGGHCAIDVDGYLVGAPELIVEIAASSRSYDMNQKKQVYARHGVQEYLVVQMYEKVVSWFALREGEYQVLPAGEDGVLRSEVFPGLWLESAAIWQDDLAALLNTARQGLASPEHAQFVERLSNLRATD